MSETRTITGHTVVMVRTTEGEVPLHRGDTLPDNLADGELARLEKVGAFAEAPVADLRRQGAQRASFIAPTVTDDLPPQVTLAANEEDGTASAAVPPTLGDHGPLVFTDEERAEAEALAQAATADAPAPPPPPTAPKATGAAKKSTTAR